MRSQLATIAIAGIVLLLGANPSAHATVTTNALTFNSLTFNALTFNAMTANALANIGSAIADLNGVAVEGITLPESLAH